MDPGSTVMGFGVIDITGKKPELVVAGAIKLGKYDSHFQRLKIIHQKICWLIEEYEVLEMAIEAPFYGKNVQSMLKLGRAQGTAIAAAVVNDLEVTEYAPRKIKQSVTGRGNASKEQIAGMLQNVLQFDEMPTYLDATDALATALCHYYQTSGLASQLGGGKSGWKKFIKDNPDRIH